MTAGRKTLGGTITFHIVHVLLVLDIMLWAQNLGNLPGGGGGVLNGCFGREVRLGRSNPDPV